MENDYIKTELQKFNVADAVIAKMSAEYLPLKVKGLDDKEGLRKVHDARMVIKSKRVEVEKKRKELKASSLAFGLAVDGEAKRITRLLLPIETYLENEESIVEKEKERLRLEAEQKEKEIIEKQKRAEEERIALIKKELDAERERQAEVARKQSEAEEKIKAEQKKIEDEKRLIAETKLKEEQEKKRLTDLEKAKQEAAEKARIETENRIKREAEEKEARERLVELEKLQAEREAELEAKRKEALKPDKEKLLNFAKTIDTLEIPKVSNSEIAKIIGNVRVNLGRISHYLISEANKL